MTIRVLIFSLLYNFSDRIEKPSKKGKIWRQRDARFIDFSYRETDFFSEKSVLQWLPRKVNRPEYRGTTSAVVRRSTGVRRQDFSTTRTPPWPTAQYDIGCIKRYGVQWHVVTETSTQCETAINSVWYSVRKHEKSFRSSSLYKSEPYAYYRCPVSIISDHGACDRSVCESIWFKVKT